jgi:hypothetical protein
MKKFVLMLSFFLISVLLFSQTSGLEFVIEYINSRNDYLDKSVPDNFSKIDSGIDLIRSGPVDIYRNQGDTLLYVNNGKVFFVSFGVLFDLTSSANKFHSTVYDALESTGWEYYNKFGRFDVFIKNNVGALVFPVERRDSDKTLIVNVVFLMESDFIAFFDYE